MKKHLIKLGLISIGTSLVPLFAFAQTSKKLSDIVKILLDYLNQALVLLMALAVVMFVWNIFKYFIKSGEGERKEANLYVMYSIIGFFVILSIWGIINILSNTFGLGNSLNQPQTWANFRHIFPQ